jgi:hypothetical protein
MLDGLTGFALAERFQNYSYTPLAMTPALQARPAMRGHDARHTRHTRSRPARKRPEDHKINLTIILTC